MEKRFGADLVDDRCERFIKIFMQKISGVVEKGLGLGAKISYPTINVVAPKDGSASGVYVCKVKIPDMGEAFGVGYFGEKSSLPADKFICEVFLFGEKFDNLYGKFVEVEFLKKIRDVQKTKNLEELKKLIDDDVVFAKKFLNLK